MNVQPANHLYIIKVVAITNDHENEVYSPKYSHLTLISFKISDRKSFWYRNRRLLEGDSFSHCVST